MSVRIGLGLASYPFASARDFWRWVDLCEDSAVDSIWQTDRLMTAQPMLEPMALMGALAGGTERLKFGMNVVVLGLRDPLVLARECATIDVLSNGRLLPAFGVGRDTAPEWAATGRSSRHRGAQADEALTLLTRLWSEERVTFEGQHYQYRDVSIAPRPAQRTLPMWIGGNSPAAIRRTARLGTGWVGGVSTPAMAAPVVTAIRAAAAEAGRTIDPDHFGAGIPFRFGSWDDAAVEHAARTARTGPTGLDPRDYFAVGDAAAIIARVDEFIASGVSKFILRPLAEDGDDYIAQTQRLIEEVIPIVHAR